VRRIGPQHQAGSDSLLTLATYFKLKGSYLKNAPEHRHANVLYGIGSNDEVMNDYVWQNYAPTDYSPVMYNSFGMNGAALMDPYYAQPDPMYAAHYNMAYATSYGGYAATGYMDNTSSKYKKYEMYTGKAKNWVILGMGEKKEIKIRMRFYFVWIKSLLYSFYTLSYLIALLFQFLLLDYNLKTLEVIFYTS